MTIRTFGLCIVSLFLLCVACRVTQRTPAKFVRTVEKGFLVFHQCIDQMPCDADGWYFIPARVNTSRTIAQQLEEIQLGKGFFIYQSQVDSIQLKNAYQLSEKINTQYLAGTDSLSCHVAVLPAQIDYEVIDLYPKQVKLNEVIHLSGKKLTFDYDMHTRKVYVLKPL
jgi:hypothetical protein